MQVTLIAGQTNGMWKYYGMLAKGITASSANQKLPALCLNADSARIIAGPNVRLNGSLLAWHGTLEARLRYLQAVNLTDAFNELNHLSERLGYDFTHSMSAKVNGLGGSGQSDVRYRDMINNEGTGTIAFAEIAGVLNMDTRSRIIRECDAYYEPVCAAGGGFETSTLHDFRVRSENPRVVAVKHWKEFNPASLARFYDAMKVFDNQIYREKGVDDERMLMVVEFKDRIEAQETPVDRQTASKMLVARLNYHGNR